MTESKGPTIKRQDFERALRSLEDVVNSPVVPGEVLSWCREAARGLKDFKGIWRQAFANRRAVFDQVMEEDPEMAHRVEALSRKEDSMDADLDHLFEDVKRFLDTERGRSAGQDSAEPVKEVERLREELLEWIVRGRAFEKEVETWYLEAQYRDRGVAD